jgi:hypothetical protein
MYLNLRYTEKYSLIIIHGTRHRTMVNRENLQLQHGPNYKFLVILTLTEFNLIRDGGEKNESFKLRMKYTLNGQLYKKGKLFPLHSMNA